MFPLVADNSPYPVGVSWTVPRVRNVFLRGMGEGEKRKIARVVLDVCGVDGGWWEKQKRQRSCFDAKVKSNEGPLFPLP